MRAPALEGFAGTLLYPRDCPDYSPRPISGPDSGAAVRFFFGEFALDIGRRELRRGAALIAMEPQVFDLLIYLVQNRERVVSKDDLIASVWHGRIVSESTLSSRIAAVRKAVGDSGKEQNLIRTAARKGIRFVGTVTEVPDDSPVENPAGARQDGAVRLPQQGSALQLPALNNLPLRRASFLGREQDVSDITGLLETTNLVTLTGAGGIGKTSLALAVAAGRLDVFRDGVWFARLAPVADPNLVPSAVADALGVSEEPGRPLMSTLLNYLRNRQLLIVLDNCEHLIEGCARLADAVLRESSQTRILATSREPLGIGGELTWRVSSLPTPDPQSLVASADLTQYPAVRLFIERAKFARPSFQITKENASSVLRICWHLDGIPLAIELAASRVKAMQVEQIVERLGDRFRLLTGGSRAEMPHQQTLLSTIDWSYSLLSQAERVLLERLSVFSGGWTLEAAETVCAGDGLESHDVLDALAHLVDKSLVILDERAAEPRYRILETIRQYGQEKLREAGNTDRLDDKHLQYFTARAEFLEPHFFHPDQANWYAKADCELDNFRGALDYALKDGKTDFGMRIVNGLHRYWVARVYWMEATGWLQRLLARADAGDPTPLRAKSTFIAGHIANYYDSATAERLGAQSLRMSRALSYQQGVVNALWLLGWCSIPRLDESAAPYFAESIELARAIDYPFGAVHACAWGGVYRLCIGEHEAAKPLLEAAKFWANRLGRDASLLGRSDGNLGWIALLQGDFAAAKSYLDSSLTLVTGAGNKNGTAEALWFHGRLALRQGDHARAIGYFLESLRLYQIYPNSLWVTRALAYLAITLLASGRVRLAAQLAGALQREGPEFVSTRTHLGSLDAISEYEDMLAQIRQKLVKTEFDAAWATGQVMSREQAIAHVVESVGELPNAHQSLAAFG